MHNARVDTDAALQKYAMMAKSEIIITAWSY